MTQKRDKRLYWTPTMQVRAGLARLEAIGLYGDTRSHAVNHIITAEITRLLESGILTSDGLSAAREVAEKDFGPPDKSED